MCFFLFVSRPRACNELARARKGARARFSLGDCDRLRDLICQAVCNCDCWIFTNELYTSVLKIANRTTEHDEREKDGELFIRGNISPDLFMQQWSALMLQRKRGTSSVCDALEAIGALRVFLKLLIWLFFPRKYYITPISSKITTRAHFT